MSHRSQSEVRMGITVPADDFASDLGSVSIKRLDFRQAEWFYWLTILFPETPWTALGDWTADTDDG